LLEGTDRRGDTVSASSWVGSDPGCEANPLESLAGEMVPSLHEGQPMKTLNIALALITLAACKKTDKEAPPPSTKTAAEPAAATPPAPPAPPAAPAKLVDVDLAPFGDAFKGYVATVPEGAKLEYDDPSRHIKLSDTDYVAISEAPFWEDGVAGLSKDPDNKNLRKVSDTEYRYERTPPLGTAWAVEVLVKLGKAKYSCTAGDPGTFTSSAMADQIQAICKSIRKK
jgi:hypothetical protein